MELVYNIFRMIPRADYEVNPQMALHSNYTLSVCIVKFQDNAGRVLSRMVYISTLNRNPFSLSVECF